MKKLGVASVRREAKLCQFQDGNVAEVVVGGDVVVVRDVVTVAGVAAVADPIDVVSVQDAVVAPFVGATVERVRVGHAVATVADEARGNSWRTTMGHLQKCEQRLVVVAHVVAPPLNYCASGLAIYPPPFYY